MSSNQSLKTIDLSFDSDQSHDSARRIVYALHPEWEGDGQDLKFKTFSEGVTNTMYKIDHGDTSLVFRAFGPGAEPLTSRPREIATHGMFASYGLGPALLARFQNGLIYSFTPGEPCSPETLSEERIWRGVARTLGRWHAILPVGAAGSRLTAGEHSDDVPREGQSDGANLDKGVVDEVRSEQAPGDIWAVMRLWAERIPERDEMAGKVKQQMKEEVEWAFKELAESNGLGGQKLVMGHCDLLAGNVLVQNADEKNEVAEVQLIDYEYSVACNAAFDIALHFGEWPGFDCDYRRAPSPDARQKFVREYVKSWRQNRTKTGKKEDATEDDDVQHMCKLVDQFRGLPGLWFGLWGLVQAQDSSEDFDYREYAKMRLGEYFVWRETESPLGFSKGTADPKLREDLWFGRKSEQ